MFTSFLASLFLALGGATPSATDASSPPDNDKQQPSVKCRSITELGTKIPKRICRTKADWDAIDEVNQENLEERRRNKAYVGVNPS